MTPTRLWVLAVIAAVCALLAWLVLREVYTSLPPLPWTAAAAMVLLGVAEALSGRNLRARIRGGPGLKPVAPLAAVRMAALGKASSHAAAVIGGLALGFLIYLTSSLNKTTPRNDAFAAAAPSWPRSCCCSARSIWRTAAGCRPTTSGKTSRPRPAANPPAKQAREQAASRPRANPAKVSRTGGTPRAGSRRAGRPHPRHGPVPPRGVPAPRVDQPTDTPPDIPVRQFGTVRPPGGHPSLTPRHTCTIEHIEH